MQHPLTTLPGSTNIVRQILANGMTVLVYENPTSPTVAIGGYVQAGSQDDPPEARGLANFTVDVMERGTRNRTFEQLYEQVESLGASFGFSSGTHTTSFGAKSLNTHWALMLDIIKDILCYPAFLTDQVEKVRAELVTDFQERAHNTQRLAIMNFYELVYPDTHPYHWSQLGYLDSIAEISQQHLIAFHNRYILPGNMVIGIVGDIDANAVIKKVESLFAPWEHDGVQRNQLPPVFPISERRFRNVTVDGKVQSNVVLGWPGPERKHPDFLPCFLANTVLGVFGMYGRLGKRIREENSLAYYAYSSLRGGLGPGPWCISTGVAPENTDKVIDIILEEIRCLVNQPIAKDELGDTKAFLTGSMPMHLETNEGILQAILNLERHHLGLDYLSNYKHVILDINSADIQAAVQRWMDPEKYAVAIAGPAYLEVN